MLTKNIDLSNKRVIVTGAAGFIGSNLCMELLKRYENIKILGIDNVNDYYDVGIKEDRLKKIVGNPNFEFIKGNIADRDVINKAFDEFKPEVVVNLAAQAGVRYSIENPDAYIEANLIGFYNILEACRHSYDADKKTDGYNGVEHLVYASYECLQASRML